MNEKELIALVQSAIDRTYGENVCVAIAGRLPLEVDMVGDIMTEDIVSFSQTFHQILAILARSQVFGMVTAYQPVPIPGTMLAAVIVSFTIVLQPPSKTAN